MWLSNIPGEGPGELAEPRTLHSTFRACSGASGEQHVPWQQLLQEDKSCAVPSSAAFLDDPRQIQDRFQDRDQRLQQLWCLPGVALVWHQPLLALTTAGGGLEGSEPQGEET